MEKGESRVARVRRLNGLLEEHQRSLGGFPPKRREQTAAAPTGKKIGRLKDKAKRLAAADTR